MALCEVYNLSVGIPAYKFNNLIYTDDSKTIKGPLGIEFQRFINSRQNFPNNCKLLNIYKVGEKLKNGSYDGALGAIDKKEIDLYLRAEIPYTDNENVHLSYPINTEKFFIYQNIIKKDLSDSKFKMQLLDSFNLEFLLYYFIASFLFILTIWIFCLNFFNFAKRKKFKILSSLYLILGNTKNSKLKYFGLLFFGLFWFDFLTKQIMTNNIKTTKVIVDTSQFITTEEELFKSPLKAAWLEGESDVLITKNAPKNTFLNKLYLLKNEKPIRIFSNNFDFKKINEMNDYFFFLKNYLLNVFINLLSNFQSVEGFYNEKPFYSVFTVFYISKYLDENKRRFIQKLSQKSSKTGISLHFVNRVCNTKVFDGPKKKVFTSLNSYIDENTKFYSLKYENFYYFFLVYFLSNFLFFIFYLSHHFSRIIKSCKIIIIFE